VGSDTGNAVFRRHTAHTRIAIGAVGTAGTGADSAGGQGGVTDVGHDVLLCSVFLYSIIQQKPKDFKFFVAFFRLQTDFFVV
jgi:hypothetical protein